MGGQSDSEIAAIFGLTPDVISWFEALQFSVRQSLRAWAYILMHCVGPGRWIGFRADELAQFWRWATLAAGPVFLDRLIYVFHTVLKPNEAPTLAVTCVTTPVLPPIFKPSSPRRSCRTSGRPARPGNRRLLMRVADASPDPDRRALLKRTGTEVYRRLLPRAFLAGKPLPKFRRPPAKATKRDAGKGSQMATGAHKAMPSDRLLQAIVDDLGQSP